MHIALGFGTQCFYRKRALCKLMAKNVSWLLFSMAVFSVIVSLDSDVFFSDEHVVLVNILTSRTMDVDDASVLVYTYDFGRVGSSMVDADENEYGSSVVLIDAPSGGYYEPIRVVLQNDDMREVKHVWTWMG